MDANRSFSMLLTEDIRYSIGHLNYDHNKLVYQSSSWTSAVFRGYLPNLEFTIRGDTQLRIRYPEIAQRGINLERC